MPSDFTLLETFAIYSCEYLMRLSESAADALVAMRRSDEINPAAQNFFLFIEFFILLILLDAPAG
ncbi:hypothetical protein ADT25_02460 [Xanthomonas oryzae]|uniref:Uncharacterized protein n=1 Tax=Xanthomonas oryzae TaxID=347 RepID=A0AAP1F082_9XANT|nr:hypothetical protein [Xanthomonas oryzae]KOR48696.1 hypothetical protein ADT25_02460 [Xanthomonas oryzae]QBG84759.1 hypothetical protein EYR27_14005 [Xanthomonas oryzae]